MSEAATRNIPASFEQRTGILTGAPSNRHTVVSMFSGCGGMDLGFLGGFPFAGKYYDRLPFEIIWANDSNTAACRTYERNLKHDIHAGDVADFMDTLPDSADVVIGGFPCQDVSINGSRRIDPANGKRTILYRHMVEVIKHTQPHIFVAENVKGLLQAHGRDFFARMLSEFESTGYRVGYRLCLAADFGVPQMRERLFLVGVKGDGDFVYPSPGLAHVTAQEVLRDLESRVETPGLAHVWSRAAPSPDQGSRKLVADRPATTIRAEHHGNVQWHYKLDRRISLREAARLQSFPDAFSFGGGMRETERQIGNAVPPVLAWHIARSVRAYLAPD